jgi:hypothetical protein
MNDEEHDIWMLRNCGVPDGGCSCSANPRPEGGFWGTTYEEIGAILGRHLDEVLG